jgi:tetratricopeptide (TPR) repeat protein
MGLVALSIVIGASAYLAYGPVLERFAEFSTPAAITHSGKFAGFEATTEMIRDFPVAGIGRGAFPTTSARYLPFAQTAEYVEDEPLQLAVDLGLPAALALMVVLALALVAILRIRELGPVECGLCAGLLALGAQNLGDFSLELSGVALPATVALAVLLRGRSQQVSAWLGTIPARAVLATVLVALPLSAWALARASPNWRHETDAFARFAPYADGAQAAAAATPILVRHPTSFVVPLAIADRYLRDRIPGAALDWAGRAMYFKRDLSTAHLISAVALAEVGRRSQAQIEARLYFRLTHGDLAALKALAPFYPDLDDLRGCVDDSGAGLLALADFLQQRKRFGDSSRAAELAAESSPDDARVHDRVANDLTADAQPDEAELEAQRGIALAPDDPTGWLALAAARRGGGDLEGAHDALEQGLHAAPGQDDLTLALARLDLAAGHPERAESDLKFLGPQVGTGARAQLFALEGEIYAREGRTVKAEESYRSALRLTPAYSWNLVVLLESESKLGAAQQVP